MERVEPGAALGFGNDAHLRRDLGTAVSHARVEAAWLRFEREDPTRSDVREASAPAEVWQPPYEPAVHRGRIGRRGDDTTREGTIWMREDGHVGIEVEDSETSSRSQDSCELGDRSLPARNMGKHGRTDHRVE